MSNAIEMIAAERRRQIEVEGYTPEKDDKEVEEGDLARAAAVYAMPSEWRMLHSHGETIEMYKILWPWNINFLKPTPGNRIRELVKAGALIVAEIERIQRKEKRLL